MIDNRCYDDRRYFVSAKEMKEYDRNTIQFFGLPSLVLMERAALACAEEIESRFEPGCKVLVAAGCGNNGGDGIAIARLLIQHGFETDVCLIGNRENCSAETSRQLEIIEKYKCPVKSKIGDGEYDIIVDALFGVGLSRNVEGIYAQAVENINKKEAFVCAVDIPSGINADSGEVMGTAVKADMTITFAFEKLGHILYPGCQYTGELICREIGITKDSFLNLPPRVYSYDQKVSGLMPGREKGGNKGTFGKALVIAGSVNMSGACELCAKSVYRIGAGMVKVITPKENREIIQRDIPEALLSSVLREEDMKWADCMIIGPGIGKSGDSLRMLSRVLTETEKPLVIDADGINLLAESENLRSYLEENRESGREIIVTPHLGEFARLYGCTVSEAKRDILYKPKELADRYGLTVVCKDARTVVAKARKEDIYLNATGNDGMATAGMGDVLTGIIGGLLAQGMEAFEAAALGVYIHGTAGDSAARENGRYSLMAGDLIKQLGKITDLQAERKGMVREDD